MSFNVAWRYPFVTTYYTVITLPWQLCTLTFLTGILYLIPVTKDKTRRGEGQEGALFTFVCVNMSRLQLVLLFAIFFAVSFAVSAIAVD